MRCVRVLLAVVAFATVAALPAVAVANPQGPIIRGGDGRLHQLGWSGSYFWAQFSPELFDAPPAMAQGNTSVDHLFVVGSDRRIYEKTWSPAAGWSVWTLVGDGAATTAPAAAMSRQGTRTDLFVRGTDNATWHNYRHPGTGGVWAGWYQIAGSVGTTAAPAVVASPSGELDLFIRGSDGQIWHKHGTDASGWTQWSLIGPGVVKSAPTAIRRASGAVEVYVRGSDDRVYRKTLPPGQGWSAWTLIDANALITAGPWAYVDQSGPDVVEVLARGIDNLMYRHMSGAWHGVGAPAAGASPDPTQFGLVGQPTPVSFPDGALVQASGDPAVYYVADGNRYWVSSPAVAAAAGLDLSTVVTVTSAEIGRMPRGVDITMESLSWSDTSQGDATAAAASWKHKDTDDFSYYTADSKAVADGSVRWYHGAFPFGFRHRGELSGSVIPMAAVGCIWAKVTWGYPALSVSFPPGGSVSGAQKEQGYFVKCRSGGSDRPAMMSLGGLDYAKAMLNSVTIEICTSATKAAGPRNCGRKKMYYGLG